MLLSVMRRVLLGLLSVSAYHACFAHQPRFPLRRRMDIIKTYLKVGVVSGIGFELVVDHLGQYEVEVLFAGRTQGRSAQSFGGIVPNVG